MKTLADIRDEWESSEWKTLSTIPTGTGAIIALLQTTESDNKELRIHRYFKLGDSWHCSVDMTYSLRHGRVGNGTI